MRMSFCRYAMTQMFFRACYDANVLLCMLWCECPCVHAMMRMLLIGMQWMWMSLWCMPWCECSLGSMPWCECPIGACHDANVPMVHVMMRMFAWCMSWCKCPYGACHDVNVCLGMRWRECFDANTIYSKIPFIFKTRLPQRLKPKYSQNLIYYSWKVIFLLT